MPSVLRQVALLMKAQMDRLDVLAHNLANVNTPGFKREVAS